MIETAGSWDRMWEIFHAALDEEEGQREAFVREACGDDPALRALVEELMAAHDPAAAELDSPLVPAELGPSDEDECPARIGEEIGPYKLEEVIGQGTFAVVFRARQREPVRRDVALKIIKLGMDTKQVIARFKVERQALAVMDHPHVAKVFDAGVTDSGRSYFVMEYVAGAPITDYCDEHQLDIGQRLGLFVQVCQALQHAHQKGIIHRDVKPTNVLAYEADGTHRVKVIDFGVAKALDPQLTEGSLFTGRGQILGTPLYMSPEQAGLTGEDVDTRSDIYSLGVLLYELLTGTLPFEGAALQKAAFAEVQRIIREVEPPKPSTRFSDLGGSSSVFAEKRRVDSRALVRVLRGDLDWITMRALEKDRNRRYASASDLAADIVRHLHHDPVLAGPPGVGYRLRKFARRNRALVGSLVAVLVVLVAGIAVTARAWITEARLRGIAVTNATLALEREAQAEDARDEQEAVTKFPFGQNTITGAVEG